MTMQSNRDQSAAPGPAHTEAVRAGPPVLLLHGGNTSSLSHLPLLDRVEGVWAIAVDRPGCGLSEPVRGPRAHFRRGGAHLVGVNGGIELLRQGASRWSGPGSLSGVLALRGTGWGKSAGRVRCGAAAPAPWPPVSAIARSGADRAVVNPLHAWVSPAPRIVSCPR
jgi:pimeloyl-ACP methyl ester carboxylesterase